MKKNLLFGLVAVAIYLAPQAVSAQIVTLVEEPAAVEGSYTYTTPGTWSADMDTVAVTAYAALVDDGTEGDSLGCNTLVNGTELDGKIAVVYRGDCEFGAKALNAENAGAIAAVIINNVPGAPVGMGAGAVGAQVTIPVVMISDVDGALLRPYIDSGELLMFIGNKSGLFEFDLGHYNKDGVSALSFATPHSFALDSSDFKVPVGTWIHNYGFATQFGITLNAVIDRDGTEVYNESATVDSIAAGDSVFVSLPDHGSDTYEAGYYTLAYNTSSPEVEGFPNDNESIKNWWINDDFYSKCGMETDGTPVGSGGLRPADGPEYMWCTMLRSNNASSKEVFGLTFATTVSAGDSLTDLGVQAYFYGWDDFYDGTAQATFDDLDELASGFYDYLSDQSGEFVTVNFETPVTLEDDRKYLSCVEIFDDNVFLVTDDTKDYTGNEAAYPADLFFPLRNGTEWFGGGFGSENVPSIITNFREVVGVEENEIEKAQITPYPNPAVETITVPLGNITEAPVSLQVFDVQGKLVYSGGVELKGGTMMTVDVTEMSGMNTFQLTFEDGSINTFKVMVQK